MAPLITAIGFSFVLENTGLLWQGGNPVAVADLIHSGNTLFNISGVAIHNRDVLAIGMMVPLVILLNWFVNHTGPGRAMRATAQDPEAARLMGINVSNAISLAFMLGGMLAGAAGIIYALYNANVWYFQGFQAGLYAFTAAVMGGIGNIRGAVIGGLIIGIVQQLADFRLGSQWTEAVIFVYLILVMVLRPRGLLGEETREAG
jgi:branched-chain amino acid transport system permease protein